MSEQQPQQFGRYRVLEQIGAGAMGAVFRARDERLSRDVAVKAIHTVGVGAFQREVFEARFNNEARALAALSHPHIVPVFDMGIEDEVPYLVMEHVPGQSLATRLETDGPLAPAEARALMLQLAGALTAAHEQQILHRDVKPANILESGSGTWKLADFGIAQTPDSTITLTGQFLGSPAYAAPESLQRGDFSPASDIYGLAATIHTSLTGVPPFGERGLLTKGALSDTREADDIRGHRPDVPADLAAVIMCALRRDPASRIDARDLIQGLSAHQALSAPPPTPNVATAAAVATVSIPPPPGVAFGASRRRGLTVAAAGLALVCGISIAVCNAGEDELPASSSAPGQMQDGFGKPRASAGSNDPLGWASAGRSDKADKRWSKAHQKLDKGDIRGAERELGKMVSEDPNDHEARALLQRIRAVEGPPRRGGKHKKRRK